MPSAHIHADPRYSNLNVLLKEYPEGHSHAITVAPVPHIQTPRRNKSWCEPVGNRDSEGKCYTHTGRTHPTTGGVNPAIAAQYPAT